jgi:hypothetical protein
MRVVGFLGALLGLVLAAVIVFILGLGPFSPGATPGSPGAAAQTGAASPAGEGTPQATAVPAAGETLAPSQTPGSSPPAGSTPGTATDALLSHVPEALRESCTPGAFVAPALALVNCTHEGQISVIYSSYPDQASMTADYEAKVILAGIENSSGRCYHTNEDGTFTATTSRWPSENGYTVNDEPQGRYLCYELGLPSIAWTDDGLYILGIASSSSGDVDRLVGFWVNEAGPFD